MFSEVAHCQNHGQQYLSAHSTHSFRDGFRDLPASGGSSASHHIQAGSTHNASFRQRTERPKQHARPLRNTAALPQQLPTKTPYLPNPESLEHMLRRKTPNGTLAAGYDGSPVEWTKRPHPVKHLLLPTSNEVGDVARSRQVTNQPSDHDFLWDNQNLETRVGKQLHLGSHHGDIPREVTQPSVLSDKVKSRNPWGPTAPSSIELDSVLNQSPAYHSKYSPAGNQDVPTVLQPMWPPCIGPTSIHSPGPCGPYWPNGAFVPYRPAPLQDPKFQDQANLNKAPYTTQARPAGNNHGQWLQAHGDSRFLHPANYRSTSGQGHRREREESLYSQSTSNLAGSLTSIPPGQGLSAPPLQSQIPLAYRNKPYSWQDKNAHTIEPAYSDTCSAQHNPIPTAGSIQFKERILVWAHRIYGNLLASIEQARRNSSSEPHGKGTALQLNLYTQAPRRPYPSWSSIHSSNTRSHSTSQSLRNVDLNSHSASNIEQCAPSDQVLSPRHRSATASFFPKSHSKQRWGSRDGSLGSHLLAPPPSYIPPQIGVDLHANSPSAAAMYALEMLGRLCQESGFEWTDGMLLTGCLAYGLSDYGKAMKWYLKVLQRDPNNVEAMSNLAATLLALDRREDAEHYWFRSVKLRPGYFEAVEHLIGLLHEGHRGREAVKVIEHVECALRTKDERDDMVQTFQGSDKEILPIYRHALVTPGSTAKPDFCSSGYDIAPSDNGRMLALVHGKGNMLYQLGDNAGAAQAFEDAILIGAGRRQLGIQGLIKDVLNVFSERPHSDIADPQDIHNADQPILLTPDMALETSRLVFSPQGRLPGLVCVPDGFGQKAAVSIVSNSLLSLAKIYQDGMSSSGASVSAPRATCGVQEILALYYLSLSLQPSPSTANNVGILLASVQQSSRTKSNVRSGNMQPTTIPGVVPGSGVALALAYYDYGLKLDTRHAHLYTNLGSLFKDIGQLQAAIKMYEKAVDCDGNFDIALANLANAVKDQGRVSDAISYYKRAVTSNPDFAEAVCGLANALNSVCSWNGRGGVLHLGNNRDRWHVDEQGCLHDAKKATTSSGGWIERVVAIVEKQLHDGESWGRGVLHSIGIDNLLGNLSSTVLHHAATNDCHTSLKLALENWAVTRWEGARLVRLVERATKTLIRQIYLSEHVERRVVPSTYRLRPQLPAALAVPSAPTVLPFHTFTCPLTAKQIRKISQRNGLRVSCSTLRAPWLSTRVYDPPAPPDPHLNVGYISSDFNNHPLAHLMQSVFGFHDQDRVRAVCYATTASDGSVHRQKIEQEAPLFYDTSSWSLDRLVNQVVADGIHILVNLNGYTRGAKNEVFAARPAPVQMSFMGFAGTLGAEWCDYLLADEIAIPPQTLRPWRRNVDLLDQTRDGNNDDDQDDWVYGENIIFTKETFFCCDHRQSAPDSQETQLTWTEEQQRRWRMRKELFPMLPDDTVILGNFNQLYKVSVIPIVRLRFTKIEHTRSSRRLLEPGFVY